MADYPNDILYAYAQLGLVPGASREEVSEVLKYALANRYFARERIARVRRLVDFFEAREIFGPIDAPFAQIRKAYHKRAMELHPDRNKDAGTEELLKEINAAFAQVEDIHREARDYFRQSETTRRKSEWRARDTTANERPAGAPRRAASEETTEASAAAKTRKFMAAPVPRSIRTMRLGYLPPRTIIGTFFTNHAGVNTIYDIVMLPEQQFLRARAYLAAPDAVLAALQYAKFAPSYSLRNIRQITVPEDEKDPEAFAKEYLKEAFGLEKKS